MPFSTKEHNWLIVMWSIGNYLYNQLIVKWTTWWLTQGWFLCVYVSFMHCIVTHCPGLWVYTPDYERTLHLVRTLQVFSFLMDEAKQIVPKQDGTTKCRQDCHKLCLHNFLWANVSVLKPYDSPMDDLQSRMNAKELRRIIQNFSGLLYILHWICKAHSSLHDWI